MLTVPLFFRALFRSSGFVGQESGAEGTKESLRRQKNNLTCRTRLLSRPGRGGLRPKEQKNKEA